MAEQVPPSENGAPPAGEQVHMPGATFLPAAVALGITLILIGVVVNWVVFAFGAVITVVAIVRWIRETREDIAHLPLEH